MNEIKAFFTISEYVSNRASVVSPIGELNNVATTYNRDVLKYSTNVGTLHVFDSTVTGDTDESFKNLANKGLSLLLSKLPNILTNTPIEPESTLSVALGTNVNVTEIGTWVSNPNFNNVAPAWLKLDYTFNGVVYNYVIWLSNSHFLTMYPKVTHQFVNIIPNITDLKHNFGAVSDMLSVIGMGSITLAVENQVTETVTGVKYTTLTAVNLENPTMTLDIPFVIAFNGNESLITHELILSYIEEYLYSFTTVTEEEWKAIFTGLTPVNTYMILPCWNNKSINASNVETTMYSTTVDLDTISPLLQRTFPMWDVLDVLPLTQYSTALYKSIGLVITPHLDNIDQGIKWSNKYPEYLILNINDLNILQVDPNTRAMTIVLIQLLTEANKYTSVSILSDGMSKVDIGGATYISKRTGDVILNVQTRESFNDLDAL